MVRHDCSLLGASRDLPAIVAETSRMRDAPQVEPLEGCVCFRGNFARRDCSGRAWELLEAPVPPSCI
jgi:hypothetical protein